jgi:hypothetical protein
LGDCSQEEKKTACRKYKEERKKERKKGRKHTDILDGILMIELRGKLLWKF